MRSYPRESSATPRGQGRFGGLQAVESLWTRAPCLLPRADMFCTGFFDAVVLYTQM